MRAVLQNTVPCYTGSIYTGGKRISNNRLVVQGTTKHIAYMEDLGLFSTLHSSAETRTAAEKVSPPPQCCVKHLIFFSLYMSVTEV